MTCDSEYLWQSRRILASCWLLLFAAAAGHKVTNLSIQAEFLQAVWFDHLLFQDLRSWYTNTRRRDMSSGPFAAMLPRLVNSLAPSRRSPQGVGDA